jgi:hypothetical protein
MDMGDTLAILLYVSSFILGYLLGVVRSTYIADSESLVSARFRPARKDEKVRAEVKIDEKKFVTEVQGAFKSTIVRPLGNSTEVVDAVGSAASRLAALKKKG